MSDWPGSPLHVGEAEFVVNAHHEWCVGSGMNAATGLALTTSTAYPAANRAIFIPFRVPHLVTAYQFAAGFGSTSGGNFDVGIYDCAGNRLVSSGATARSASTEMVLNITDTVLGKGLYYMAFALDGTNNVMGTNPSQPGLTKMLGLYQMSSAYTLPATATFEAVASSFIPNVSVWLRSQ